MALASVKGNGTEREIRFSVIMHLFPDHNNNEPVLTEKPAGGQDSLVVRVVDSKWKGSGPSRRHTEEDVLTPACSVMTCVLKKCFGIEACIK